MQPNLNEIFLFIAIEATRDQLKRCNNQLEMREVHERLISLYACIDTNSVIDKLSDKLTVTNKAA